LYLSKISFLRKLVAREWDLVPHGATVTKLVRFVTMSSPGNNAIRNRLENRLLIAEAVAVSTSVQ
jgi:hypothetical protein